MPLSLQGHESSVNCLAVVGDTVYSGSSDGTIRGWDAKDIRYFHYFRHQRIRKTEGLKAKYQSTMKVKKYLKKGIIFQLAHYLFTEEML